MLSIPFIGYSMGRSYASCTMMFRVALFAPLFVLAGLLAGLLPALRAYRLSVADGMTIRT